MIKLKLSEVENLLKNNGFEILPIQSNFDREICRFDIKLCAMLKDVKLKLTIFIDRIYNEDINENTFKYKTRFCAFDGICFYTNTFDLKIENAAIINDITHQEIINMSGMKEKSHSYLMKTISDKIAKNYDLTSDAIESVLTSRENFKKELRMKIRFLD